MLPVPTRPWYGVFVQDQVEDLRKLGLDVEILFVNSAASRLSYFEGLVRIRRTLGRFRADIVHAHYGLTGAVAVTQAYAPVLTTFHGSDCNGSIPWQKVVSWAVARRSTPVFVSKELAAGLGCPEATVIPAAVDLDVFKPVERSEARRALGWPVAGPVALLPGSRSHKAKGAPLFDAALEEAQRRVRGLRGVSLEGLSREQVATTMNAVDVTVMTSTSEGSPIAMKESLACLTPVVSVPVGDAELVLGGLQGCAVVPREPAAIAAAIEKALGAGRPPDLREAVAAYGRPLIARRVLDTYRNVLESRRS